MPNCASCGCVTRTAMQGGGHTTPICMSCYKDYQIAETLQHNRSAATLNMLSSQLERTMGIPGIAPRSQLVPLPPVSEGQTVFNNIKIDSSTIGSVNTGTLQLIDSAITANAAVGHKDVAKAIRALTEAVVASASVDKTRKDEILQQLSFVSEELASAPGRRRQALLKMAGERLRALLSIGADFADLLQPILNAINS